MRVKISALLFIVLLFLGCTEMTREEKNICFSLATKSYVNIPDCFSETECFEKTASLFPADNLEYSQQRNIYSFRNHIGRSWYYFNLAENENEKVSILCKNGNTLALPGAINQARFYFGSALTEMDHAIKASFDIVSKEENSLTKDNIELIKEEEIYLSLVSLRQVLSDLENGPTNSKTYVSYYYEKLDSFEKISRNRDFYGLIENKPYWLKIYEYVGQHTIISVEKRKEISLPFLRGILENSVFAIENQLYFYESIEALKAFPIYELMKLYSEVGGNQDSVLARFSDIIKKLDVGYAKINLSRNDLWEDLDLLMIECKSLVQAEDLTNNFPELERRLDSFGKNEEIINEFLSLNDQVVAIKELKSLNEISLGEEISFLKDTINKFKEIKYAYLSETKGLEERMLSYCDARATGNLSLEIEEDFVPFLVIWEKLVFLSKKTLDSEGRGKLVYCEEMLIEKDNFIEATENYEDYLVKKAELTKDCFSDLENLLSLYPSPEINDLFENLKREEPNEQNLLFFQDACNNLIQQIKNNIDGDNSVSEIISIFEELQSIEEKNYKLCNSLKSKLTTCGLPNPAKNRYSLYFDSGNINYQEILSIKNDLLNTLKQDLKSKKQTLISLLEEYVSQNFTQTILSPTLPKTNIPTNTQIRFSINNSISSFEETFSASCGVSGEEVLRKDVPISGIDFVGGFVSFTSLPKGTTMFEYSKNITIKTEEQTELISASNEKSIFQRKIYLKDSFIFPKLEVTTTPIENTSKSVVLVNGQEIIPYLGENLTFVAQLNVTETPINIFFYVDNLISLERELKDNSTLGLFSRKIEYFLHAKNNSSYSPNATLVAPIGNLELIESISLSDSFGSQLPVDIFSDKIIFEGGTFSPKQEKTYLLTIRVSDKGEYYKSLLTELLFNNQHLLSPQLVKKIERLLASDFESTSFAEAEELIKEIESELDKYAKEQEQIETTYLAKRAVETKISELESLLLILEEKGLFSYSTDLATKISQSKALLKSDELSDIAKAQEIINSFSIVLPEDLIQKTEEMWDKVQSVNSLDTNIQYLKILFFEKKQLIETQISDPLTMLSSFIELEKIYNEILALSQKTDMLPDSENLDLLFALAEEKISFLESELSVDGEILIKSRFIPPITISRLKKLHLEIITIKSSDKLISEKEQLLLNIIDELEEAVDFIKLQTITRFNEAIDRGAPQELLSESKALLDSNQFVTAFILLANNNPEQDFSIIILGFLPIFLIILIAFFLKLKLSSRQKMGDKKRSEVDDTWQD